MNIHVRNMKNGSKSVRSKGKQSSGSAPMIFTILKMLAIIAAVFLIVNLRISVNEKTERLNREATLLKSSIHTVNREIEHLKVQKEKLSSWPLIRKKIKTFRLALRAPEPRQIKQMIVLDNRTNRQKLPGEKEVRVSQR